MREILKWLWDATAEPIYRRLFRQYFQASISRLNTVIGEVTQIRTELHAVSARLDYMDERLHTLIAAHWEDVAVELRTARVQAMLEQDGASSAEAQIGDRR